MSGRVGRFGSRLGIVVRYLLFLEVQALRHPMAVGGDHNDEAWCTY